MIESSKEQHLKQTNYIRIVLVMALCIMFAGALIALLFVPIPDANRSAVDILIGSVNMVLGIVFGYYFGNSAGSIRLPIPKTVATIDSSTADEAVEEEEVEESTDDKLLSTPLPVKQPNYEEEEHYDRY